MFRMIWDQFLTKLQKICKGSNRLRKGFWYQQLQLVLQSRDDQVHHSFVDLRRVLNVDLIFFHGKLTYEHAFEGISEFLVFADGIFDISQSFLCGELKKHAFMLGRIIDKNSNQQRVLQFENGSEGVVLKTLLVGHIVEGEVLFDFGADA